MKPQYKYPDPGDAITFKVIDSFQTNPNYWSNSERWILNNIHQVIRNKGISNYTLLDAGCGEGRLFSEFINDASQIVGVEPDVARFNNAQICIKENDFGDKVQIYNATLEGVQLHQTFDVVLSSHIIQHIPSGNVNAHLLQLANLTKDNGLLIINTNASNRSDEYFIKGFIEDETVKEIDIPREEFDKLTMQTGELPVHMFNRDKICEYMLSIGFDLVDMKVFHVEKDAQDRFEDEVDSVVNADPVLARQYGRDICFIFQKQPQVQIVNEGALAEFCAFNIKLYGIEKKELQKELANFQTQNELLFKTAPFCNTLKGSPQTECRCGDEADAFCRTGQMINRSYRYFIGTTYFKFKEHRVPLKISVTLFPYRNIGIICLNVIIKDLSVDEIIAIKQYFGNTGCDKRGANWRTKCRLTKGGNREIELGEYFSKDTTDDLKQIEGGLFWFMCNNLIKDMCVTLNRRRCNKFSLGMESEYLATEHDDLEVIIDDFRKLFVSKFIYPTLEITKTNFDRFNDDAVEWTQNNSRALYGMLVGDEGYKYIPEAWVQKRISEYHWGTRRFVNIFAYSFNIIMVNFKHSSNAGKAYMERQKRWSDQYYDSGRNEYFTMRPCIAGVDHGLFRSVERNIVVYFENEYISKVDQSSAININKKRNKILLFIYKTATSMDEINDLFNVIANASGTASSIESIKQRLALRSEEKNLINQNHNNLIILVLTIASVILGLLAIGERSNAYQYVHRIKHGDVISEPMLWGWLTAVILMIIAVMVIGLLINWEKCNSFAKLCYYKIRKIINKH